MSNLLCKIEGCDRGSAYSERGRRGFCRIHYSRLCRHGDPLGGGTVQGDVLRFINDVAAHFKGAECLTWPFSNDGKGYGQLSLNGRVGKAHRYVCEIAHGKPTVEAPLAAHSCGNGHLGCVNPAHLSWKTHAENMKDMVAHGSSTRGERSAQAKLTEADAKEILRMKGKSSLRKIAVKFGVQASTISRIHTGHRWSHLTAEGSV